MRRILVGNVDAGATEDMLRSAFEPFGVVVRVHLTTSEGFALVEMRNRLQADRAIAALDGTRLSPASRAPLFLVPLRSPGDAGREMTTAKVSVKEADGRKRPKETKAPGASHCTNAFSY